MTEQEVLANAGFMARRMLPSGWDTVVVDIDGHDPAPRSGGYTRGDPLAAWTGGLPTPAVERFPCAAHGTGFTGLAAGVHELGLRFAGSAARTPRAGSVETVALPVPRAPIRLR